MIIIHDLDLDWQDVGSNERQMGPEVYYDVDTSIKCKCGIILEIHLEGSEYPIGAGISIYAIQINYNYKIINSCTDENKTSIEEFESSLKELTNIVYFFYYDDECLYIGESKNALYDRCYKNTPKEKNEKWFKESNKIFVIQLDENIDDIARQTIESVFIVTHRPKYNKKA